MNEQKMFKKFKQRLYRDSRKETTKQSQRDLYDLYRAEYIPCAFCGSIISLHYSFYHLKSKKCKEVQKQESNQKMIDFKKEINRLKSQLRFDREASRYSD